MCEILGSVPAHKKRHESANRKEGGAGMCFLSSVPGIPFWANCDPSVTQMMGDPLGSDREKTTDTSSQSAGVLSWSVDFFSS